jgi:hypothetical protein
MSKTHWTEAEIDLLRKYYLTSDISSIQKLFPNRSWNSILHKAERLRLINTPVIHRFRPINIPDLPLEKKCYVAGIVDGEGTISISFYRPRGSSKIMPNMMPIVLVSNSNRDLINYLHPLLLGSTLKTAKATDIRKEVYAIQVARLLDVEALLTQILPYLVVKRRQAELVLEYCALRKKDTLLSYNDRLFEIAKEVRGLNEKGPVKFSGLT